MVRVGTVTQEETWIIAVLTGTSPMFEGTLCKLNHPVISSLQLKYIQCRELSQYNFLIINQLLNMESPTCLITADFLLLCYLAVCRLSFV